MKAIAAMSENRVIGNKGQIPWQVSDDFRWFKEFTTNKVLIVGFNTYKALPNLNGRKLIVLDRYRINDSFYNPAIDKVVYYASDDIVVSLDNNYKGETIVIGGAKTYNKFMPHITEFYVTHIKGEYQGDAFMPSFEHLFSKQEVVRTFGEHKVIKYVK